jgi:hypothetical protein
MKATKAARKVQRLFENKFADILTKRLAPEAHVSRTQRHISLILRVGRPRRAVLQMLLQDARWVEPDLQQTSLLRSALLDQLI